MIFKIFERILFIFEIKEVKLVRRFRVDFKVDFSWLFKAFRDLMLLLIVEISCCIILIFFVSKFIIVCNCFVLVDMFIVVFLREVDFDGWEIFKVVLRDFICKFEIKFLCLVCINFGFIYFMNINMF